jgi:hypothetical protein
MKNERVELGDVFYVFTNFGLAKGHVVKIIESVVDKTNVVQYKLNMDDWFNDGTNYNQKCGFFYSEDQLFEKPIDAIVYEIKKYNFNELPLRTELHERGLI